MVLEKVKNGIPVKTRKIPCLHTSTVGKKLNHLSTQNTKQKPHCNVLDETKYRDCTIYETHTCVMTLFCKGESQRHSASMKLLACHFYIGSQ